MERKKPETPAGLSDPMAAMLKLLVQKTGVSFHQYKPATLQRRIVRRMHLLNIREELDYLAHLAGDEGEQHRLYKEMLVHVTSFFRDEGSFDYLCGQVIPAILSGKGADDVVRIWVCGCATGEEAYSVAICLHEHLKHTGDLARIKIFASDLSESAIAKARKAVYPHAALAKIPEDRLETYFEPCRGGRRIRAFLRDLCVFAVHDVLSHPPFANLDLVTCRNMLIYMQPVLQRRVLATFSYALRQDGYLFLGKSETNGLAGKFEPVSTAANIYRNRERYRTLFHGKSAANGAKSLPAEPSERIYIMEKKDFQRATDEVLLARYIPAGVVVNDHFDIVDFRGNMGFYIEPSPGIASLSVLKMIRKGLYFDLQEALNKVKAERVFVRKEGVALEHDGQLLRVTIEVQPLAGTKDKFYLILFHNVTPEQAEPRSDDGINNTRDLRIHQLEQELMQSREQLRALSEEQEATHEEFQSANDELKSLNEELQASQEELISTNEELSVRNRELNSANAELGHSRELTDSILNTTNDCLVVLDKDLCVRTANQAFYDTFRVAPEETEGSFIYDLGNKQWNIPELRRMLSDVLLKKAEIKGFVVTQVFEHVGQKVMHLNARRLRRVEEAEPLMLLVIMDVTEAARLTDELAEKTGQLRLSEERQRLALAASRIGIWDFAIFENKASLSKRAAAILKAGTGESAGLGFLFDALHPDERAALQADVETMLKGRRESVMERELRLNHAAGEPEYWIYFAGKTIMNGHKTVSRFTGIVSDISEQRRKEKELRDVASKLNFALITGHIGSWELDLKTLELKSSPQCRQNFGLGADARLSYERLQSMILPEDVDGVRAAIEHAILTGEVYDKEYRVTWPDDTIHWICAVGIASYDEDGKALDMTGVTMDITDRKAMEQKLRYSELHFRTLANSAPVLIAMSGPDGVFNFYNQRWLHFTGRSEHDHSGSWQSDIHPEDLAGYNASYKSALKEHGKFDVDFRLRHQGRYRWVSCSAVPRFGVNNRFDGYTMACTDVHDQKMTSEALERRVDERTEALRKVNDDLLIRNQELEQFAYATSHDLQEPLRKIRMATSVMLHKNAGADLPDYLNKIEGSAARMIGLIQDLLNFSSLKELGREFVPTDLNRTLQNVLTDFDLLIHEKNAQVTFGTLPTIDAVPLQMNRLFYNLLGNALKFSRPGEALKISVTATNAPPGSITAPGLDPAGHYVRITVADNGIGMEEAYHERIFHVFQQPHSKDQFQGNGIGLALCLRIAQNHRGAIVPRSVLGEGSGFEVLLPLRQA